MDNETRREFQRIVTELQCHAFRFRNEAELQAGVAEVLGIGGYREGVPHRVEAEAQLGERERIDFWLPSLCVGIETKVAGSLIAVSRQLQRYALQQAVAGLILVTRKTVHLKIPRALNGKPVEVVLVGGGV